MEQLWKMQKKPGESSKRWSRRAALGENSQAQRSAESLGLDQTKLAQHFLLWHRLLFTTESLAESRSPCFKPQEFTVSFYPHFLLNRVDDDGGRFLGMAQATH
jgi:hypothetical protein